MAAPEWLGLPPANHLRREKLAGSTSLPLLVPAGGSRRLVSVSSNAPQQLQSQPPSAQMGPQASASAALPPARPLPMLGSTVVAGRPGASKLVSELLGYAATEMRVRAVPDTGYSDARLAVWREVFASLLAALPTYSLLLMRIAREYDVAIENLRKSLEQAESGSIGARADERVDNHARREPSRRVESMHVRMQHENHLLGEPQRALDELVDGFQALPEGQRAEALRRMLTAHGGGSSTDGLAADVAPLVDGLPERLRGHLGTHALRSLPDGPRKAALRALKARPKAKPEPQPETG